MHDSPYSTKRFFVPRVIAACLAIPTFSAQAQISMTGAYTENFDATLGTSGTTIPTGWTLVGNGATVTALSLSDSIWAGTPGNGYNAALQTDIRATGDSTSDRGLSIYGSGTGETRNISAAFRNDTGGEITSLAVNFSAVLYGARFDSSDGTRPRWDGLILQLDSGSGTFATVSPTLEATFTSALVTFANDANYTPATPNLWNGNANGWATAAMIAGSNKKPLSGTLSGLTIAPNAIFRLRWVSKTSGVALSTPATYTNAQQYNMNIGVDDLSIIPTFVPPALPPNAPSDLVGDVLNSSKIQLTWTDNSLAESGFRIERSATGADPWTQVTTTGSNVTSFLNTGLTQLTPYFYRVIAVNGAGDSAADGPVSVTTLADSPGQVRFVTDSVNVAEDVPSGTVTLSVERIGDSDGAVSVDYATLEDTAMEGSDYTRASGTLNWADGDESVKTFTIAILNDSEVETVESLLVVLSHGTGGLGITAPDVAYINIDSEDTYGVIKFSAASYTAAETAGTVTVTAQRTGGSGGAVSIDYATSDGTALAGTNYTAASGTLNWANGDAADKTFTVTLFSDSVAERSRVFNVTLSNPGGGATVGSPIAATVSIANDDAGFVLLDDFSSGTVDGTVPGWMQNPAGADTQFLIRVDPANAANKVAGIKRLSGSTVRAYYLPLGADSIPDGSTGTLFMRFRLAGGADTDRFNLSLGLSDEVTPTNNYAHYETQAALANTANAGTSPLGIRNAGNTPNVATVSKNTWYNLWFVANNSTDTYDVHLDTGTGGATAGNRIATGFVFRNGPTLATNPLRHVLLILGSPTVANPEVYLDDVYLDRFAANLANPLSTTLNAADQWRQTYFGSPLNSGDGADGNDFDKDGLVNLLERAFKTNPKASSSSYRPAQSIVNDGGNNYLAISYRQLTGGTGTPGVNYIVDGMQYTVEHDDDLVAPWTQGGITVVSVSTPVDGVQTVTVRLNTPITSANKQFVRLNVTAVNP